MRFVANHNVTPREAARAVRLTARRTDLLVRIFVVVVLIGILSQVLYAFALYLRAAAGSPAMLLHLLRFERGTADALLAWLSIIVTLSLPVFLFYALRSLAETIHPALWVRRAIRNSDIIGPTTYTVDDDGVRAVRAGGTDVFMPWRSFDGMRSDGEVAALMRKTRLLFFVPLAAFGTDRDALLAQMRSQISPKG